jgi:hypothetical protein
MAKFYGAVGYGHSMETSPGVWEDVITERNYYGDVVKISRKLQEGESVNNNITVSNSIEIVADAYANEHFFAIRYIYWAGTTWVVSDVDVRSPRLVLRLGGVYNGPKAGVTDSS